jgi:hypothetical protein
MEDIHKYKYLKYKTKYLNLIKHIGGVNNAYPIIEIQWRQLQNILTTCTNKPHVRIQLNSLSSDYPYIIIIDNNNARINYKIIDIATVTKDKY